MSLKGGLLDSAFGKQSWQDYENEVNDPKGIKRGSLGVGIEKVMARSLKWNSYLPSYQGTQAGKSCRHKSTDDRPRDGFVFLLMQSPSPYGILVHSMTQDMHAHRCFLA